MSIRALTGGSARLPTVLAVLAATLSLLAGCGQRGPLYLPEEPPPGKPAPEAPRAAPDRVSAPAARP